MIIYIDVVSGDEVFADSYPVTVEDDVVYAVETKNIVITEESYVEANTEEGEEAPLPADAKTVNNLEDGYHLQATSFDKKSYGAHLKAYMGAVKAHLEKTNPERVADFMKGAQTFAKRVLGNFSEYEFYTTESMNPDGIVLLKFWKDEATTPTFYIWKDGLTERRV